MKTATANSLQAILLFGLMGLVGPCVRWLTWPPSAFEQSTSTALSTFVYDLVFLLWPTQLLAVMEVNIGVASAGLVAVSANVLLFAMVGAMAGILVKSRRGIIALYLSQGLLVFLLALWGAGFSIAHLNVVIVVVALLMYAVPFILAVRLSR
jgi:hypothetical protein